MSLDKINAAKAKKPEERTPEEVRLANLQPWGKGQSGNPKGKPKGCRNWANRFQQLMGDEEFLKTIVSKTPSEWNNIVGDTPADLIAAAFIANVTKEMAKSLQNNKPIGKDTRASLSLLNKMGYGDKIVHDIEEDSVFERKVLNFKVVPSLREEGRSTDEPDES